jgi:lipoyl-dependent peroxiredoxin
MKIIYTAKGHATGGREGKGASDDGKINVTLTPPKEMGGTGTGTNPEQLFAVGYSACFLGAMRYVGGQTSVKIPDDAQVNAEVGIGPRDDGQGFGIAVKLHISLPGFTKEAAADLIAKTHVVCPYSHATKGNITVENIIL